MSHLSQIIPQSLPAFASHLPRKVMLWNRVKNFNHRYSVCIVQIGKKGGSCFPRLVLNPWGFPHLRGGTQDFHSFFHIITIFFTAGVKGRRERVLDSYRESHNLRVRNILMMVCWDLGFFSFTMSGKGYATATAFSGPPCQGNLAMC